MCVLQRKLSPLRRKLSRRAVLYPSAPYGSPPLRLFARGTGGTGSHESQLGSPSRVLRTTRWPDPAARLAAKPPPGRHGPPSEFLRHVHPRDEHHAAATLGSAAMTVPDSLAGSTCFAAAHATRLSGRYDASVRQRSNTEPSIVSLMRAVVAADPIWGAAPTERYYGFEKKW